MTPDLAPGYFVEPTVFAGVKNSMRIAQEEIFGPVGALIPVDGEEEAISIANPHAVWTHGGTLDSRRRACSSGLQPNQVWRSLGEYISVLTLVDAVWGCQDQWVGKGERHRGTRPVFGIPDDHYQYDGTIRESLRLSRYRMQPAGGPFLGCRRGLNSPIARPARGVLELRAGDVAHALGMGVPHAPSYRIGADLCKFGAVDLRFYAQGAPRGAAPRSLS